jgi:cytochrome c5
MNIRRYIPPAIAVATFCALTTIHAQEPAAVPAAPSPNQALVNKYCAVCHNERLRTAELLLDKADVDDVTKTPQIWEKAVKKLRAGQMPPLGAPRPDKATLTGFTTYL